MGLFPTKSFNTMRRYQKLQATSSWRQNLFLVILSMILYNVTVSINPEIEGEWTKYMREVHIPEVLETGMFKEARFCRVHGEEQGGVTYATGYLCPDQASYDRYMAEFAEKLRKSFHQKWEGHYAAFRTLLSVIEEFK